MVDFVGLQPPADIREEEDGEAASQVGAKLFQPPQDGLLVIELGDVQRKTQPG